MIHEETPVLFFSWPVALWATPRNNKGGHWATHQPLKFIFRTGRSKGTGSGNGSIFRTRQQKEPTLKMSVPMLGLHALKIEVVLPLLNSVSRTYSWSISKKLREDISFKKKRDWEKICSFPISSPSPFPFRKGIHPYHLSSFSPPMLLPSTQAHSRASCPCRLLPPIATYFAEHHRPKLLCSLPHPSVPPSWLPTITFASLRM